MPQKKKTVQALNMNKETFKQIAISISELLTCIFFAIPFCDSALERAYNPSCGDWIPEPTITTCNRIQSADRTYTILRIKDDKAPDSECLTSINPHKLTSISLDGRNNPVR